MPAEALPLLTWEQTSGWIDRWTILGFFPSGLVADPDPDLFGPKRATRFAEDFLEPWGGESNCALPNGGDGAEGWQPVALVYGPKLLLSEARRRYPALDRRLGALDSNHWDRLWYACAVIESDRDIEAVLHFCAWDGCRLFVNGLLVFEERSYHHIVLEKELVPIRLRRGRNILLFKMDRDGCAARVSLPAGSQAVLRQVSFAPSPPPPRYSTMEQLRRWSLSKQVQQPFHGTTLADLQAWQERFREHYLRCLGPWPEPDAQQPELIATENLPDGMQRRRYELPEVGGGSLPFYLMTPPPGLDRRRVVVVAHGHEKHWQEVAGAQRGPRAAKLMVGGYTGDYALQLAHRGWTTVVCCQRGFGERNDHRGPGDKCDAAAWLAMAQGHTYVALHLHDLRRITTAVQGIPGLADHGRPGLLGLSGGGSLAYLLAAADETYAATALFCCICRYRDYALGAGCGMQIVPLLYPTGDVPEVLSLIAPRPLLIAQGRLDSTFNLPTVRAVHAEASRAWLAAGAPEGLHLCVYERAHQVDADIASQFFADQLTSWR
jgi:dienelactone hydrolase